jgi:hypothetical protein
MPIYCAPDTINNGYNSRTIAELSDMLLETTPLASMSGGYSSHMIVQCYMVAVRYFDFDNSMSLDEQEIEALDGLRADIRMYVGDIWRSYRYFDGIKHLR